MQLCLPVPCAQRAIDSVQAAKTSRSAVKSLYNTTTDSVYAQSQDHQSSGDLCRLKDWQQEDHSVLYHSLFNHYVCDA